MTGAGLLHSRHVHARRSFPGITFLAKTCNDGGRALGVVDIGAARHCNSEQRERGSVARLHALDLPERRITEQRSARALHCRAHATIRPRGHKLSPHLGNNLAVARRRTRLYAVLTSGSRARPCWHWVAVLPLSKRETRAQRRYRRSPGVLQTSLLESSVSRLESLYRRTRQTAIAGTARNLI